MAIFKCKICGGSLEIDASQSVATCEYCGTKQTLPKLDDERRANLYDRANHFRRNNDFDKAMGIYENILNEDNTDAEAYWSLVLCRYGIEYVEDPVTHKRVPTVNRAQFTSIFDDEDYKSAIANADGYQREIYEAEATAINEIQKGILAISQKEEPFDVFICYKETDTSGRRTQDSVLATELYHELAREGFKVFFSRITLEDKLGVAYEPYIFAALHSAKVMVVLGTRPEHFTAVWVKNEWSRFLALIKNGAKKTLIPAYRDMDPYDLPEEFSHLQAQDMSKLGFMQDLTRGIKKIVEADAPKSTVKETIVATVATINIAPLLKRAFMFLEDGDFDLADEFCEQVLNQDPENAQAYLGKLMAELRVKRQEDLANCAEPFENNKNYEKTIRFADTELATKLRKYQAGARKEALYLKTMDDYKSYDVSRLQKAIKIFEFLSGYKDSDERVRLCQAKIDQIKIEEENKHREHKRLAEEKRIAEENERIERERLAEEKRIADEKARLERQRQVEIDRVEAEKKAKRRKKLIIIGSSVLVALITFVIVLNSFIIPNKKYNDALSLMNQGKYTEAVSIFASLDGYKESSQKLRECHPKSVYAGVSISSGGGHTVGLRADGSVIAVGEVYYDACDVTDWDNIIAISAGYNFTIGLNAKGTVVAAGDNEHGQCNVFGWSNIVAVSTGHHHTVGLKSDGTVVATGENDEGQCNVSNWKDIIAISAGGSHTVGLKSDGTVIAVGYNDNGACDVSSWREIISISAGNHHTLALKADGTAVAVGSDIDFQCNVSDWKDIIAVSAGDSFSIGLKLDGTVVAAGYDSNGACDVEYWNDIIAISAGYDQTMGLKSDGTVVAVGSNLYGKCDVDAWNNIFIP